MCFLMEGNNFSHTNTFLFESILFFFCPPPKIRCVSGREAAPRKAPSFREESSTRQERLPPSLPSPEAALEA